MKERGGSMRIVVTGGRNYKDRDHVNCILDALRPFRMAVGDCPTGADLFVREWAEEHNEYCEYGEEVDCVIFKADWKGLGRKAGPIRNRLMIEDTVPDLVLAFPGGVGTEDCVKAAKESAYPVLRAEAWENE